jgi:hypothetical protein
VAGRTVGGHSEEEAAMAAPAGFENLDDLPDDIGEVEFKHTAAAGDEDKVPEIFGNALKHPERRKVYFYDTRARTLFEHGIVLRARVTQGDDDDSTVKIRPASLDDDAPWREIKDVAVELDVSGKGPMCSAKLDEKRKPGEIEDVDGEKEPISSLFTKDQEKLVKAFAPDGVEIDDLEVLGPVDARKWEFDDLDGVAFELTIEEWLLPDTTRFIEFSTKVDRKDAAEAQKAFRAVLERFGADLAQVQDQKTPLVLKFFATRLSAGD